MTKHHVKSWSHFFDAIKDGRKLHDLRKLDRDYNVGDILVLQKYDNINGNYTGDEIEVEITYITSNKTPCAFSSSALDRDYGIFSLRLLNLVSVPDCNNPDNPLIRQIDGDRTPRLVLKSKEFPKFVIRNEGQIRIDPVTPNPNAEYYQGNSDRELHWEGVGEYRG